MGPGAQYPFVRELHSGGMYPEFGQPDMWADEDTAWVMRNGPNGPVWVAVDMEQMRRGRGKERRDRDEDRGHPNSKIQLPWFLYFDGKYREDGQAYPLKEYEKRVEG